MSLRFLKDLQLCFSASSWSCHPARPGSQGENAATHINSLAAIRELLRSATPNRSQSLKSSFKTQIENRQLTKSYPLPHLKNPESIRNLWGTPVFFDPKSCLPDRTPANSASHFRNLAEIRSGPIHRPNEFGASARMASGTMTHRHESPMVELGWMDLQNLRRIVVI